jgi:hypothetical protein
VSVCEPLSHHACVHMCVSVHPPQIIVGALCLVFGLVFWLKHFISPRDLGSMKYFNWPGSSKSSV